MLYGVSYYHEYQPYERLEEDARMMREADISYARVGDSVWSLCEPSDGRFELDWLERILDALHEAGIAVILTTPTYAIPPWLYRKYPEVMARYGGGETARYGGRQNTDFTHPAYRYHAERIIRKLVGRYAPHPAIIGYQLDNETGTGMLHNRGVIEEFFEHLKEKYGDVETVNEIWGLNYWSHRLGDWADLWPPDSGSSHGTGMSGNTNPGYDLEWRRFQSSLTMEFLGWQAGIVREYARTGQFVTQDVVGGHGRGDSDSYEVARVVDVLAMNSQHSVQDALALPNPDDGTDSKWWSESGVWALFFKSDLAWGAKRSNFLVTESNPLSVGGSSNNFPAYDGQWRMAAYSYISRGADAVAYWHWHSCHYGHETYSHGILNHDLDPNRCYREVSRIGHELREHGDLLTGLAPDSDVAFLYSEDSKYALEFQPCLRTEEKSPDRRSYQRIFNAFYRGFFESRAQAAIVHPAQNFEEHPILVAPALYVADDTLLERLVNYAENGGHLLLSFRGGYADEYARARWQRAPGPLRAAVGASYNEYSNLAYPLDVVSGSDGFSPPSEARAEGWADSLELEGATPLAYYDHPHFGRFPAITTHAFGAGRVTYVGALPNRELGKALAKWALRASGAEPPGEELPESVRVTTATARDGERLWFFTNWAASARIVAPLSMGGVELFGETRLEAGDKLPMERWDVKVVVEK